VLSVAVETLSTESSPGWIWLALASWAGLFLPGSAALRLAACLLANAWKRREDTRMLLSPAAVVVHIQLRRSADRFCWLSCRSGVSIVSVFPFGAC